MCFDFQGTFLSPCSQFLYLAIMNILFSCATDTPRISNGGLLVVLRSVLCPIARVPGQVIALKSATAHTRNRCVQLVNCPSVDYEKKLYI